MPSPEVQAALEELTKAVKRRRKAVKTQERLDADFRTAIDVHAQKRELLLLAANETTDAGAALELVLTVYQNALGDSP